MDRAATIGAPRANPTGLQFERPATSGVFVSGERFHRPFGVEMGDARDREAARSAESTVSRSTAREADSAASDEAATSSERGASRKPTARRDVGEARRTGSPATDRDAPERPEAHATTDAATAEPRDTAPTRSNEAAERTGTNDAADADGQAARKTAAGDAPAPFVGGSDAATETSKAAATSASPDPGSEIGPDSTRASDTTDERVASVAADNGPARALAAAAAPAGSSGSTDGRAARPDSTDPADRNDAGRGAVMEGPAVSREPPAAAHEVGRPTPSSDHGTDSDLPLRHADGAEPGGRVHDNARLSPADHGPSLSTTPAGESVATSRAEGSVPANARVTPQPSAATSRPEGLVSAPVGGTATDALPALSNPQPAVVPTDGASATPNDPSLPQTHSQASRAASPETLSAGVRPTVTASGTKTDVPMGIDTEAHSEADVPTTMIQDTGESDARPRGQTFAGSETAARGLARSLAAAAEIGAGFGTAAESIHAGGPDSTGLSPLGASVGLSPTATDPSSGMSIPGPAPLRLPLFAAQAPHAFVENLRWMSSEGVSSARIALHPAGLGSIDVQLTLEQDALHVSVQAGQATTREALEQLLPRLREQLAASGFDRVNVDISDRRANSDDADTARHGTDSALSETTGESPTEATDASVQPGGSVDPRRHSGLVYLTV